MSHSTPKPPADVTVPPDSLWARLPVVGGALAVIGLGAVLAAAAGEGRARAMFSYLFAFEVCLSIALGALGWVIVEHMTRSGWSVVVRRLGETAMATLPVFAVLWLPIGFLGLRVLFPWVREHDAILARKTWFLAEPFFYLRAVIYFVVWGALSVVLYRTSTRGDSAAPAEQEVLMRRMWRMSPPALILWALTLTLASIDWLMSLQPHWYSTIFGVYYYAGATLSFYAFTTLVALGLQRAGVLKEAITTEHFHDLGKYMFGYTIFWAYIAFSQFLLIWYATLPEETRFFSVRMAGGWAPMSYWLPVLHFAGPFLFLLSRHIKRSRAAMAAAAIWILAMQVMDIYWLVLPNFKPEGQAFSQVSVSWTDVAALVGMAGAFMAAYGMRLKSNKVVAINDPRLFESLAHENY